MQLNFSLVSILVNIFKEAKNTPARILLLGPVLNVHKEVLVANGYILPVGSKEGTEAA